MITEKLEQLRKKARMTERVCNNIEHTQKSSDKDTKYDAEGKVREERRNILFFHVLNRIESALRGSTWKRECISPIGTEKARDYFEEKLEGLVKLYETQLKNKISNGYVHWYRESDGLSLQDSLMRAEDMLLESRQTPYKDRNRNRPTQYAPKTLTLEQWEAYKEEHLRESQ